jgi:hypothetical protein
MSVTTLEYLQLWQDSDRPSRANIPLGELTEIRRCKPRHCPLLLRPLPTRCSRPLASDFRNSPQMANRVRQTGNFRTIGRRVRRGVERRYGCDEAMSFVLPRAGLPPNRSARGGSDVLARALKEGRRPIKIPDFDSASTVGGQALRNRCSRGDSRLVVSTARALHPASLLLAAIRCPER